MVGDILVFSFTTGAHDVAKVLKTDFEDCTKTNPIGSIITTGPANMTLDSEGDHYYICTIGQHCTAGQKLAITVATSSSSPTASASPPPATPVPTSGTPADCTPTPSSLPTAGGPSVHTPPLSPAPMSAGPYPDSSSPVMIASFCVTLLSMAMGFLL